MEGKSLRPLFEGKPFTRKEPIFFSFGRSQAIRSGKWKMVRIKGAKWQLYDMENDRTELNDIAQANSKKIKELSILFDTWAKRCFVE